MPLLSRTEGHELVGKDLQTRCSGHLAGRAHQRHCKSWCAKQTPSILPAQFETPVLFLPVLLSSGVALLPKKKKN